MDWALLLSNPIKKAETLPLFAVAVVYIYRLFLNLRYLDPLPGSVGRAPAAYLLPDSECDTILQPGLL